MRIVILAGADRTGKSTLTGCFEKHGYIYKHFGPPAGSPYLEYRTFIEELSRVAGSDARWIIDRFMYCEFPYSKHYGRKTDMTIGKMHEIEDMILALDPKATVVYCETDLESNWKRIEAEGKREFESADQLDALRTEYKRVILNSRLNLVEYDFTRGNTPEKTVADIEAMYTR